MPTALKTSPLLLAIATPITMGSSANSVGHLSCSPSTRLAIATVDSGSLALSVSTKLGAAMAMAAFVSRNPKV